MTQKEYKEKLDILEKEKENLQQELEKERVKTYNYEHVLEQYFIANEDLKREKEFNIQNVSTIERLQRTIEQYEKILDRFSINC